MRDDVQISDYISFMVKIWDPIENESPRRIEYFTKYQHINNIFEECPEKKSGVIKKSIRITSEILRIIFESNQRQKILLTNNGDYLIQKECIQIGIFNLELQKVIKESNTRFFINFPTILSNNHCIFFFNSKTNQPLEIHHYLKKKLLPDQSIIGYSFIPSNYTYPIIGVSIARTDKNEISVIVSKYLISEPCGRTIPVANIESMIIFHQQQYKNSSLGEFLYQRIVCQSLTQFESYTKRYL